MDTRYNQLVVLSKRVKETNDKLNIILKKLGWTHEELRQHRTQRQCPFNKQHVVTEKHFKQHYRKCLLKSRNVSTRLPKPLPSSLFFYQQAKTVVSIPTHVLPSRQAYFVDELAPLCTTAEKRAEYDAIIDYKRRHGGMNVVDYIKGTDNERVQGNRARTVVDDKRRPKQYRGKIKSMSPTEIQRELIHGYMQEFNTKT